ncbi:hypothetical protein DDD63_00260 [Actinobaculum sp. 313]|nr:hypothetical protein DDD63_00260 [Actinobaculum sp. 313]
MLSMLLSLVGVMTPARAANNPNIVVSDLTLTRTNNQNADWPGQLTVGQYARLDFKWDATNADVKNGDSFTIDLGTYFENLEYPRNAPMTVTNNGQQIDIGTCRLTKSEVVCTFNSKVDELKQAGFDAFRGTGSARLRAVKETTSKSVDIKTNNVVSVELPPPGGIGENVGESYETYTFYKWAGALWDETGMTWGINFGTKYVGDKAKLNLDGSRKTIVITDELGEGMQFRAGDYLKDWVLFYRGSDGDTKMQLTRLTDASGADATTQFGNFDMNVEFSGRTAKITITGPFKPNSNYTITYPVSFTGGKVIRGVLYGNSATLSGTEVTEEDSRYFVESFSITVEMQAGFGGFDITKIVAGQGAASVPAATEFTVDVKYELPAVASTYENWQAPGTLNPDGKTGTAQMKAIVGQKVPFDGTFPKGTKVTLSEDPSTSTYTALGWSEPEFLIGGKATNTLTIGDRISVGVTLTNTTAPQGTFAIKKVVSGADEAKNKQFVFDYECTDNQSGSVALPGDGTAVEVGKSFPIGTTCTITERVDGTQLEGYTLSAPQSQTVEITDVSNIVEVSFTNAYTRDRGSFSVKKAVTGDYKPSVDDSFKVNFACNDPDGTSGSLTVPADGSAVSVEGLPTGTTCTVNEDSLSAERTGYAVATSYSSTNVTIEKSSAPEVTVTNEYKRLVGGFTIAKTVAGDGANLAPASFEFEYSCADHNYAGTVSGTVTVKAGSSESVTDVPTGTCTVREMSADVANTQLVTKMTVDGRPVDGNVATINVTDSSAIAVEATNTYTMDRGTFAVKKSVSGTNAATSKQFIFNYQCSDDQSGSLTVPGDGTVVESDKSFPIGTTCTIAEDEASAQIDEYSLELPAPQEITIADKTAPVEVAFANDYKRQVGGFSISKKVDGDGANLAPANFTFDYACVDAAGKETASGTLQVAPGASASAENVPTGACTVTERAADVGNAQLVTKLTVDGQEVDGNVVTINVTDSSAIAVEATNTYTLDRGKFSVKKTVSGASVATGKEFVFNYQCSDDQSGSLTVPGDGTVVESDKSFPIGTTCEVSEDSASAQIDEYSVRVPDPQTVTISDRSKPVEVSFTNDYKRLVGGFSISKKVDGDGASLAPVNFAFDYACVDAAGEETVSGTLQVTPGQIEGVEDVPTGTCEISERDATVNGAQLMTSWTVDGAAVEGSKATISVTDGSAIAVEATNTYTRDRGSFSVAKKVTGDYTSGTGESFKVNYVCDDPDQTSGVLDVPGDGTPVRVDNLPTGTSCVITEDGDSARRDGYAVATTHTAAKVMITKDQTQENTITNDYRRLVGGFTVAKTVDGDGAQFAPQSFGFDYTCVDGAGNETMSGTLTVRAGKSEQVTDVPVGSCTVTEKDAFVANAQVATRLSVDGNVVEGKSATIEIGDGSAIAVEATNTYTLDRGSFSVVKKVSGADVAKGKSFTFAYECSDGSIGSLTVPGDGTVVKADKTFPVGTACEVVEDVNSAQLSGYTVKVPAAQKVGIEEKDKVVELSFTNTYTENTPPPPSKTPTPKKSLPRTGADLRVPGLLALLAVSVGGGALWLRRRKA